MMTDEKDDMLDDILGKARRQTPQPDDALMARVLADAAQVAASRRRVRRPGYWAQWADALGGWPAVAGLAAATIAGIWVGVAPPASVENLAAAVLGDTVAVSFFALDTVFDAGEFSDG